MKREIFSSQIEGVELYPHSFQKIILNVKTGTGNLDVAHHPDRGGIKEIGNDVKYFGINTKWIPKEEFDGWTSITEQFGAVFFRSRIWMNPMAFMNGFASATVDVSETHSFSRVKKWERNGSHKLITDSGSITANKVVVATMDTQTAHPSFANRMMPVLSNIIVTREMSEDEFKLQNYKTLNQSATLEILYYYRRMPSNRMLFGTRGDTYGDERAQRECKNS